jgi:regulator of protease activity HflC (stomatin/prohibitin superfamily)
VTRSLEKVFARASRLPAEEQDALAEWLAEERWGRAFRSSQDELGRLADEALKGHASGKTERLDLGEI